MKKLVFLLIIVLFLIPYNSVFAETVHRDGVRIIGGLTVTKTTGVASKMLFYEATGDEINGVGWRGPGSRSADLYLQFPDANPGADQFLLFPAPTGDNSLGVWTTYGQFGALTVVTTGTISGLMPTVVENTATTYNITQAQARAGTFFVNTNAGTKTWILPAAEAGMAVCVRQGQGVANIMRADTDGTDYLVLHSTGVRTTSAGDYIEWSASAKNQFCAVAFDGTDWYITSETTIGTEQ